MKDIINKDVYYKPNRYKIYYSKENDSFNLLFGKENPSDQDVNIHSNIVISANGFKKFFNSMLETIIAYDEITGNNFLETCIDEDLQVEKEAD